MKVVATQVANALRVRLVDDNAYSVSFLLPIHLVNIDSNVTIEVGSIVRLASASLKPTLADRAVNFEGVNGEEILTCVDVQ